MPPERAEYRESSLERLLGIIDLFTPDTPEQSDVVVTYSRGQTLPRFTGSNSLTILAHLPTRTLARIFEAETAAIVAAGLGASWDAFTRALSTIRKAGIYVTHGAIDPGTICTAVPIFSNPRNVVGALCLVQKDLGQPPMTDAALVASAGADISGRLGAMFAERKHYAPIGSAGALHAR